jgi:hypothetical protein
MEMLNLKSFKKISLKKGTRLNAVNITMETPTTPTKDRLKKKLKKKQLETGIAVLDDEPEEQVDIFKMISQVQAILKTNPELVNKVSNCVNSLMTNPEIMQQLSSQIEKTVIQETNLTSSSGVSPEACSK